MFSVEKEKSNNKIDKKVLYIISSIILILITGVGIFIYLNTNNYDNIKKDVNKDLVYTRFKRNIEDNKTEVPIININSTDADKINKEIVDIMNGFLKEENNLSDYEYSINKNILSVVLVMINNNTDTTPKFSFKTYNINLTTLKKISNSELLSMYNTNETEVSNSIKNQFKEYYEEEISNGYIVKEECDYKCYITWRGITDYIDKVEYYVDDNKLYAYKEFNPYSIYEEEDYYNLDSFMFYIKD